MQLILSTWFLYFPNKTSQRPKIRSRSKARWRAVTGRVRGSRQRVQGGGRSLCLSSGAESFRPANLISSARPRPGPRPLWPLAAAARPGWARVGGVWTLGRSCPQSRTHLQTHPHTGGEGAPRRWVGLGAPATPRTLPCCFSAPFYRPRPSCRVLLGKRPPGHLFTWAPVGLPPYRLLSAEQTDPDASVCLELGPRDSGLPGPL